jgi:chemotaxis protein methyltransferase CheR
MNGCNVDLKILATDISTRALGKCREGRYSKERIKDVPVALRRSCFDRVRDGETDWYEVRRALKSLIVFKRLNLANPPFAMRGPFDAIFCRNVMIYFDRKVKRNLLADMYRLLRRGGYLIVGHAESLSNLTSDFKPVKPSIYVKGG